MTDFQTTTLPNVLQFDIGLQKRVFDAAGGVEFEVVGHLKKSTLPPSASLFCIVENFGEDAFTIDLQESSDNGDGDAWAGFNFISKGASVGDVLVPAFARVEFQVLEAVTREDYYRVLATTPSPNEGRAYGRLTLAHFQGMIERHRVTNPTV